MVIKNSLAEEYAEIVEQLESIETEERLKALPHLLKRAPPLEVSDLVKRVEDESENGDDEAHSADNRASLCRKNLRSFSLSLLPPTICCIITLDVGNNELADLPGLSSLPNLETLILTRNWFNKLPSEIGSLRQLRCIDASRNFLRPNQESLRFSDLRELTQLQTLDLQYNQKCGRSHHVTVIQSEVPQLLHIKITIWEKICSNPGSFVASCAAERDACLMRSQLEPWGTVQLRRRLVSDFDQEPTDPQTVDRAAVMQQLLECYQREGMLRSDDEGKDDLNNLQGRRRTLSVQGTPVSSDLLKEILAELRSWRGDAARGGSPKHRERPSIRATCYMILRAPDSNQHKLEGQVPPPELSKPSRRAVRTAKKMERNRKLWDLALQAMESVDPQFASQCTEVAVTFGFQGSPHIDKQNCGPFYGLALGDFRAGTGQVCVECSARVVAEVDTRNRLGRIDGRYPHWVTPYDAQEERFSLIYYQTGGSFVKAGPAVFSLAS